MQKITYEINNAEKYSSRALYVFSGSYFLIMGQVGVDMTTRYGLDGPRIELGCRRDSPHLSRSALGPTQTPMK